MCKIMWYKKNYFKTILYLNTEKAYNMLTTESKNLYPTYESFVNELYTIYDSLSTNLMSYAAHGDPGKKTYSVISINQKRVSFYESGIMEFKVNLIK